MIHVDFTITQRDLFRVNLALAKVPLALGCAIGILAVGSLCWFFWLIDEARILFQLSPLFVGVPLISVAGQVLRLHATCRRFYRTLPDSQRRAQYLFQEIADGYDVIRGGSFSHILWQDLMQVVELRDYFIIYINQFEPRILLKNGFHDQLDIPLFRRILLSKLGNKAKLLNGS